MVKNKLYSQYSLIKKPSDASHASFLMYEYLFFIFFSNFVLEEEEEFAKI